MCDPLLGGYTALVAQFGVVAMVTAGCFGIAVTVGLFGK